MMDTDAVAIQQWLTARDPEAFRVLVVRYSAMVYSTCRRVMGNAADAEDAAQESFQALAMLERPPKGPLGPWLHKVAVYKSLNQLRADKRREERGQLYAKQLPSVGPVWNDLYEYVDEAIAEIPDKYRIPVVRHFLHCETQDAIAHDMGLTRQTVAYRIQCGLNGIRKSLRCRGVIASAVTLSAMLTAHAVEAAPASLVEKLGKLAVAGSEVLPAATAGTSLLGGLLSLKGALTVSVLVAALGFAGYETFQPQKSNSASQVAQDSPAPSTAQVPEKAVAASAADVSPAVKSLPESAATAPAPGTVNVTGDLLMEGSNAPCKSLSLVFKSDTTGKELHARTETTGRFELRDCVPGSYHVFLEDDVRVLKNMPVKVNVRAGKTESAVHLVVDAGASVSGQITDKETGIGVPGAGLFVAAIKSGQNAVSGSLENKAYTDPKGRYQFEGLRPGNYRVFLEPDITACDATGKPLYRMRLTGSNCSDVAVTGRQQIENIDFPLLLGGAPISGMVRDAKGRPAAGARVEAAAPQSRQETETKNDGTFTIRGLAATANCRLLARLGMETSEFIGPLTVPEQGLKDVQVQLRPGGVIRGILTDDQGTPLVGNTLNAMPEYALGGHGANTDKDGAFQFNALAEGSYEILLTQQTPKVFMPSSTLAKVDVKWGQVTDNVALVYKPSSTAEGVLQISGRVKDAAGQPLPGVGVDAQFTEMGVSKFATRQAWTDGDGYYRIEGLEKKAYCICAHNDACVTLRIGDVEAGSANVNFVMQPRVTVEGRVISAEDGQPVTQFEITAPSERPVQVADAAGRFTLANVDAEDTCRVTVRATGFIEEEEDVDLKQGKGAKDVVIKLNRAAGLTGRVLNTDWQPVAGARIFVAKGMDRVRLDNESAVLARSGADGAFQIDNLPAERGFVLASHTEYAAGSAPYRPGIFSVDIVMHDGGTVTGAVALGGAPAAGVTVTLGWLPLSLKEHTVPLSAKTGPDGTFRFEQVPPGETNVIVAFDKDLKDPLAVRSLTRRITVESGQTISIAMELPEATAGIEGQVRLSGHPAASAFVMFTYMKDGVESPSMAQADANGFFMFDAVPAGSGTLRATVPGSVPGLVRTVSAQVEAVAGQVVRQDLDTTDTGVIVADLRGVIPSPGIVVTVSVLPGDVPANTVDALINLPVTAKCVAGAVVENDGPLRFDMLPPRHLHRRGADDRLQPEKYAHRRHGLGCRDSGRRSRSGGGTGFAAG